MPTTTIQPLPYPSGGDPASGPAQIKALAEAVEGRTVMRFASLAARDAALPSGKLVDGMVCHVASENGVYVRSAGAWQSMWRGESATVTPASGFTGSRAIARRSGPLAHLSGALVASAPATVTTGFTVVGTLPDFARPAVDPVLAQSRFFTVAIFGAGVAQLRISTSGVVDIRALTGTLSLVAGTAIYIDGVVYDV